jgi:hypothetical protein
VHSCASYLYGSGLLSCIFFIHTPAQRKTSIASLKQMEKDQSNISRAKDMSNICFDSSIDPFKYLNMGFESDVLPFSEHHFDLWNLLEALVTPIC